MAFDSVIFQWLNSWTGTNSGVDQLIIFRAVYLWYIVMAAVLAIIVISLFPRFRSHLRKNLELLLLTAVSALTARFIIAELIRFFYSRPRPFEIFENIRQLVPHDPGASFPSGHASLSFAVAAAVYFYYPKTSILFFLAALSIGLGRVAAGVHWPSDVIGGAIVGVGSALTVRMMWKYFKK